MKMDYVFWVHVVRGYVEYVVKAENELEAWFGLWEIEPNAPEEAMELVRVD